MMPRLQAEEMLDGATMAALGAGSLKRHESERILRDLRRQAGESTRAAPADPRALAMMGIAVTVVEATVPPEGAGD
jgi:hypothetical protein